MCTTAVCDAPIDVLHLRNFRFRLIKFQYFPCVLSFWRLVGSSFPIKLTAPLIISKTLVIRPYNRIQGHSQDFPRGTHNKPPSLPPSFPRSLAPSAAPRIVLWFVQVRKQINRFENSRKRVSEIDQQQKCVHSENICEKLAYPSSKVN